jgi:hypothetical protein
MKLEGLKITKILPIEEGTSKAGKSWKKVTFVGETEEQYNNLYAFEMFQGEGKDNVDKFVQFNKEGDVVDVDFNVQCREWNERYFTNLSAWSVWKSDSDNGLNNPDENTGEVDPEDDDLPF